MNAKRITSLQPIVALNGHVGELPPLSDSQMSEVINLAHEVGFEILASVVPDGFERIRLNDPDDKGYHRDYWARFDQ